MKTTLRHSSLFLLLFLVLSSMSQAQELVQLKMPKSGKVVLKYMFRNGSVADPEDKAGLTNLTADLMIEGGTSSLTSTQVQKMIYPWAARMSSFTDKEVTTFTFEVPSDYIQSYYKIIHDLLLSPGFGKSDFKRLLSNQQNYVAEVIRQSSDEEYAKKYLENVLFEGTPYQHLTVGSSASLEQITYDDVIKQYKTAFTRNNLFIGIAGDYPEEFAHQVIADMQALPEGPAKIPALVQPKIQDGTHVSIISKDGAIGSAISAGFPMNLTRSNDEFAALMVANSWLGEHRKSYSHLYQKIREARSMNYGDYSYIEWYENGGGNMLPVPGTPRSMNYFSIWLRPVQTAKSLKSQYPEMGDLKEGHARFALHMALNEMNNLVTNGMSESDFQETRNFLLSYTKLYVESMSKNLGFLLDSRFYGRKDWLRELNDLLLGLTVVDVNNAMKQNWQSKNLNIVIVTDKSEVDGLKAGLEQNAPAPMNYSAVLKPSLPNEIFEEDKIVEKFSMPVVDVKVIDSESTFLK